MSLGDHRLIPHRGMITVSIMLATIMQALDNTIANVALPHMQGALQSSQDQISWVLTSYIVAAAIATPLTGWLCSAFGRRRVFLFAVAGFSAAERKQLVSMLQRVRANLQGDAPQSGAAE